MPDALRRERRYRLRCGSPATSLVQCQHVQPFLLTARAMQSVHSSRLPRPAHQSSLPTTISLVHARARARACRREGTDRASPAEGSSFTAEANASLPSPLLFELHLSSATAVLLLFNTSSGQWTRATDTCTVRLLSRAFSHPNLTWQAALRRSEYASGVLRTSVCHLTLFAAFGEGR
jgi:hypothetical protein